MSHSGSGQRSSGVPSNHNNKIPIVPLSDRRHWKPPVDPSEAINPPPMFTRTSSFYETKETQGRDHHVYEASDVRRQAISAPSNIGSVGAYPKYHGNRPPKPLTVQPPLREFPLTPSPDRERGRGPTRYRGGVPGPSRMVFNEGNRAEVDVIYHDMVAPPTGPRNGSSHARKPFEMARYHQAPTYTDTSTLRER